MFEESKSPERPKEMFASTITADDCSIIELDKTHMSINSRLEASGSSK